MRVQNRFLHRLQFSCQSKYCPNVYLRSPRCIEQYTCRSVIGRSGFLGQNMLRLKTPFYWKLAWLKEKWRFLVKQKNFTFGSNPGPKASECTPSPTLRGEKMCGAEVWRSERQGRSCFFSCFLIRLIWNKFIKSFQEIGSRSLRGSVWLNKVRF